MNRSLQRGPLFANQKNTGEDHLMVFVIMLKVYLPRTSLVYYSLKSANGIIVSERVERTLVFVFYY